MSRGEAIAFRWLCVANVGLMAGLVVTGFWLALTRRPDPGWSRAVAEGTGYPPVPRSTPLQDVHTMIGDVFGLVALGSIAWLIAVVIAGWSWSHVGALVMVGVAAASGSSLRFLAVVVDGSVAADLRGFGFVFDPGFDEVVQARWRIGSGLYRTLVAIHLVAPAVAVALAVRAHFTFGAKTRDEPPVAGWLDKLAQRSDVTRDPGRD